MKRKVLIALLLVTLFSIATSFYVSNAIEQVAFKFESVIMVYRIQLLREKLVFQLRKVQTQLVTKDTQFGTDADTLTNDVMEMSTMMTGCYACHHTPEVTAQLDEITQHMEEFKRALSRAFTMSANTSRYLAEVDNAAAEGQDLLQHLDGLTSMANSKLENRTHIAMDQIYATKRFLTTLVLCLPVFIVVTGLLFLKSIAKPLSTLLHATRKLAGGDLHHRIEGLHDEFGELAASFNTMADSIADQMKNMQRAEQLSVIGQMAAGLAHEIKNPLAGIKVSMEVLAKELDIEEEDRRILSMVVLEINHINALINELLNFARPSEPHFDQVCVNTVLEQTIATVAYSAKRPAKSTAEGGKGYHCVKEFAPDLPEVKADPAQLHQIFINLILNGFEAMPRGGTVMVKSAIADRPDQLCVTISDQGPGLSDDIRERIFQPFFTTKKKGTGLGLAICKRLIEQQHGTIMANNNIAGGGASFSVLLPIAKETKGIER